MLRSVKNTTALTLKELSPREEVLNAFLHEAEGITSSRPLAHVSVDVDSEYVITPFTFLIGSSNSEPARAVRKFDDTDLYRRADWRKTQR